MSQSGIFQVVKDSQLTASQLDALMRAALQQSLADAASPSDIWGRIESRIYDLGTSECVTQGEEVVLLA